MFVIPEALQGKVIPGWQPPELPPGFLELVYIENCCEEGKDCMDMLSACDELAGDWVATKPYLDKADWPWVDGYKPTEAEWKLLGFQKLP